MASILTFPTVSSSSSGCLPPPHCPLTLEAAQSPHTAGVDSGVSTTVCGPFEVTHTKAEVWMDGGRPPA